MPPPLESLARVVVLLLLQAFVIALLAIWSNRTTNGALAGMTLVLVIWAVYPSLGRWTRLNPSLFASAFSILPLGIGLLAPRAFPRIARPVADAAIPLNAGVRSGGHVGRWLCLL